LSSATFDDSFFNDAFDADFLTPYNMAPSPAVQKKSLIAEIDAQQNADDGPTPVIVGKENLTCVKIWYDATSMCPDSYNCLPPSNWIDCREKLQNCPKVQNGDFDLDGLCSELQKKAKCTGNGPVVAESDFKTLVKKYMDDETCLDKPTATTA
jgi:AP-1-like transcription factor